jgi:putative restriction endonuclease
MKIWVGVTDKNWYEHLTRLAPEEVNFWQPSGSRTFRVLQPGEAFLFKLHSPDNFIV